MGPKSQDHFHCRGSRPKLRGLHLLNALNFGGSILAVLLILTGRSLGGLLVVSCSRGSLLVAVMEVMNIAVVMVVMVAMVLYHASRRRSSLEQGLQG